MSEYTIRDFWLPRLRLDRAPASTLVRGWSFLNVSLETFVQAPLTLDSDLGAGTDPQHSPLLLVSAPGAVGKTTLARQIALETGAAYVDLAAADPVGGNTLSGGLVKSGLYSQWNAGATTVLVDGLDEARMRVTQEAYEAFLRDVAEISKGRAVPTVLFGRTAAVEDAWLVFSGAGFAAPVLEIGYFGPSASIDFAVARLRAARSGTSYDADRRAVTLLLERLRAQTESEGDRFAGYAPVIQAIADRVEKEGNPQALVAQIESGEELVTLYKVARAILERERAKLSTLSFEDRFLIGALYQPEEQLDRLVAQIFQLPPPDLPQMLTSDAQTYLNAVEGWFPTHPFLKGTKPSSSVFEAMISVRALKNRAVADVAVRRELLRGAKANPFLSEFYMAKDDGEEGVGTGVGKHEHDPVFLPPEHVGVIYASLRARLSLGDAATLAIEGTEEATGEANEEDALRAEIEITLARRDLDHPRVLRFDTEQAGSIRLGAYVEDVEITAPHSNVEIGPGPEAVLVAPVAIQCDRLALTIERLIVESHPGAKDSAVSLEARVLEGEQMNSVPVVRSGVTLIASWTGVRTHPWISFAGDPTAVEDPRVDEGLRRFRKFVTAFRSHSKGNLARYRHKIEHARMTKGAGRAVLDLLLREHIVTLKGDMYFLDPDQLGARTGATYADCAARRFTPKTIDFVKLALPPSMPLP